MSAEQMEEQAKKLEKLAESQLRTQDYSSLVDGRITSGEPTRAEGRSNQAKARDLRNEARAIKTATQEIVAAWENQARTPFSATVHTLTGVNGATIQAQLLEQRGNEILILRGDGTFFLIQVQQLTSESAERVRSAFHLHRARRTTPKMQIARKIILSPGDTPVGLLMERGRMLLISRADGTVEELAHPLSHGTYASEAEAKLKKIKAEIETLKLETREKLSALKRLREAAYREAGGLLKTFVVERALSFTDFPLNDYGHHIYQVRMESTLAILVTRETQYTTTGHGVMPLKFISNFDVNMKDGTIQTVPAFVEIDEIVLERIREFDVTAQSAEKASKEKLAELTKREIQEVTTLENLEKNAELYRVEVLGEAPAPASALNRGRRLNSNGF